MDPLEEIVRWLSGLPSVRRVIPLEGDIREMFFEMESSTTTTVGIPLVNDSIDSARSKGHVLAIVPDLSHPLPLEILSSIVMRNSNGDVVGREVHSEEERAEIDARGDHIWLSNDFAVSPDSDMDGVVFALPENPFPAMERCTPAKRASAMFPSTGTILALSEKIEGMTGSESLVVVSFDCRGLSPCGDRRSGRGRRTWRPW